ncbi:MAG: P1 family peptidase [Omnitrophica WOR_2 bacterium]
MPEKPSQNQTRLRLRDYGIAPGILPTGAINAITDVQDVLVGHFTLIQGEDIRTGATSILPHGGNLFQDKVPAGVFAGNGYGKLTGSTQIQELGEIETPIVLTNTLATPRAADAILDWTLNQPGNESATSVNPVVGETNDSYLNNIRRRVLSSEMILQSIHSASSGLVKEGTIGSGTGTMAFGWKGGIGTSSRRLPDSLGGFTVGVLVQSNFAGVLQILGISLGKDLDRCLMGIDRNQPKEHGSIMIVIATDAPLSDRNLTRLARRGLFGMARTGASFANGSGDYAIAFSTHSGVRRTPERRRNLTSYIELPNDGMSPLFQAALEATEEAIYNSLFTATTVKGYRGTAEVLPVERVIELLILRD